MKKILSIFALSMLTTVSAAFAGTIHMNANDYASLSDCGGVIQTKISNGGTQLNLIFSDVAQCSNFDILSANGGPVDYPNKKLQGRDRARSGSFTIPASLLEYGKNKIQVVVKSNSGKTSDTIIVTVRETGGDPDRTPGSVIYMGSSAVESLGECGGTVETKVSGGSQLNVIFSDVENCSNFDILSANGEPVDYPNMKLQGVDGARSGSFTLPKRVIDFGTNSVRVQLQSNSGKTSDTIVIHFHAY